MELFLVVLYFLVFSLLIYRSTFYRLEGITKTQLLLGFALKVVAGLALGYLYTYHYTDRLKADTLKFFDDSKVIFDLLKTEPVHFLKIFTGIDADDPALTPTYMQLNSWMYEEFMNSNRMMVRIDVLFRFLVPGNFYFVHVILINFLSFTGLIYLGKIFSRFTKLASRLVYLLLFLIPSLLFWGSGLLKESFLLFALGVFLYHYFLFLEDKRPSRILPMALGGLLLVFIKLYIPLVLAPPLLAYYWTSRRPGKVALKYIGCCLVFFLLLFHVHYLFPDYDLSHYLYIKQRDFLALVKIENPGSAIAIPVLEPEFGSIAKNLPQGFLTTLTRPWFLESRSPLILLAGAENLVILCTLLVCILAFRKPQDNQNFFAFSVCIVIILFSLIGLVTPIEGAIVRYKCVGLPFHFAVLLSMTDTGRLKKLFLRNR